VPKIQSHVNLLGQPSHTPPNAHTWNSLVIFWVQINWPSLVVHPSHNGDDELLLKNKAFSSKENAMEKEKVGCDGGGGERVVLASTLICKEHTFLLGVAKKELNWSLQKERNTKST